jgi:hypothetical protein
MQRVLALAQKNAPFIKCPPAGNNERFCLAAPQRRTPLGSGGAAMRKRARCTCIHREFAGLSAKLCVNAHVRTDMLTMSCSG